MGHERLRTADMENSKEKQSGALLTAPVVSSRDGDKGVVPAGKAFGGRSREHVTIGMGLGVPSRLHGPQKVVLLRL